MSGHAGTELDYCPECAKVDGWQGKEGLRFAAQHIRHEATTEEELDLAEICEYVAETHQPDEDGNCRSCGQTWIDTEADLGVLRCQAFLDATIEKNFWVMRKVDAIYRKWMG